MTLSVQPNARELKKQRTRRQILNAAIQEFAESGFDAASMGVIARRAGLKKALVQYHFETKINLWKEAVDALWQHLQVLDHHLPPEPADGSPEEERRYIREVFRQLIRFARDHPAWVGVMFREASTPGPRLDWLIERHLRRNIEDGTRLVKMAQRHGVLPQGSPLHIIHIISGALTYLLLVAPLTERVTGVDLRTDESLDTTVDLLMNMLAPS